MGQGWGAGPAPSRMVTSASENRKLSCLAVTSYAHSHPPASRSTPVEKVTFTQKIKAQNGQSHGLTMGLEEWLPTAQCLGLRPAATQHSGLSGILSLHGKVCLCRRSAMGSGLTSVRLQTHRSRVEVSRTAHGLSYKQP